MTFRSERPVSDICEGIGLLGLHLVDTGSQLLNGLLLGNPAETISSRAFRSDVGSFWYLVRRVLDAVLSPRKRDWCSWSYQRCLERSKRLLRDD